MLSETRARRRLAAVLLLALMVSPRLDADPASDAASGAGQTNAETAETAETAEPSSRDAPGEGQAQESVEPFVPSESISADSAVAFPVDI